jgi:hypothetical protein
MHNRELRIGLILFLQLLSIHIPGDIGLGIQEIIIPEIALYAG